MVFKMPTVTRIYLEDDIALAADMIIALSHQQSHYLKNVLRKKSGDALHIFNKVYGEFSANISEIKNSYITILVGQQLRLPEPIKSQEIGLVFAPVKNTPAHNIAIKATELDVDYIQPIVTEYTIVNKINIDKLYVNSIQAAQQCERLSIPKISDIMSINKFIDQHRQLDNNLLIFCDESDNAQSAKESLKNASEIIKNNSNINRINILIGPEGGFSDEEREKLYSLNNLCNINLGNRILKADTAIITALSIVQFMLGDWR
ncbi:MAG: RsmE family RNA methyltransferase [Pseudomonadota bacterium]